VWFVSVLNNPNAAQALGVLLPLPVVLFLTSLAALLVTVLPRPITNIASSARTLPGRMVITGGMLALMTVGVSAAFIVAAAYVPIVALILCPFYLVWILILLALVLSGWVTITLVIGNWVALRLSARSFPPIAVVVMGGVVMAAVTYALGWLPAGDIIVIVFAGVLELMGLGAAYATRFGRRPLVRV
jgi:hypothetical protein